MSLRLRFRAGDVVYFHHLHTDKRVEKVQEADEEGNYRVCVEGKRRPMNRLGWYPA